MRIGVYGGTFDPIHVAHIVVACEVRHALDLDEVLLVPAGDPWQKRGLVEASKDDRARMCELAVDGVDGLRVSRIEVDREGASVTAETLAALSGPDRDLFLVLGADAIANMPTWRGLEATRTAATIAAVERDGEHATAPGPEWSMTHVPIPRLDVSSSEIRARRRAGRPIDGLVPAPVVRFIGEHDLYTRR
ncbi:MAG: nicotinate (nicotinamide) nucleotide adenylyltransferase [Acidimicrobiia bacterium]|nr:nicotinate (nicotinamide) nucleotide adenylyltransferase [Acidimicrobiia bacterium]